jgi:hypothetical protein
MLAKAAELEQQAARMREVAGHVVTGAEGEEAVGATLDALKPGGWVVLHDRRKAPRSPANIDHLVVGPMGLLVIDTKKWSGHVTFNGTLRCNRYSRQSTVTDTVEVADLLRAELAVEGFGDVPVTAVLCFEGDAGLTRAVEVSPNLFLVPGTQLTSWLAARPRLLVADRAQALGAYLDRAHRPRSEPSGPARAPYQPARSKPSQRLPGPPAKVRTASPAPTRVPAPRPPGRSSRRRDRSTSWAELAAATVAILIGIGTLSSLGSGSTESSTGDRPNTASGPPTVASSARTASSTVCSASATRVGVVLGLAVTGAPSSSADECEYRTAAGLAVVYTRVGSSVRTVSGMATLTAPTPVQLSCGEGYFQPVGQALPGRPTVTASKDAATCVSNLRLGWTHARAARAARELVTVVEAG